LKGAT